MPIEQAPKKKRKGEMQRLLESNANVQGSAEAVSGLLVDFSRLKFKTKIGQGATAAIWKGTMITKRRRKQTERDVAIKQFYTMELDPEEMKGFIKEAAFTSQLNHENIVQLLGVCIRPPDACLVLELCERGSLNSVLYKSGLQLRTGDHILLCLEAAKGVNYLHERNLIHRDIKSMNLLVTKDWKVKLADFGESRLVDNVVQLTSDKGSILWSAPEVLQNKPYDQKADIYSLGIVFWEIITQKVLFENLGVIQIIDAVCRYGARPPVPIDVPTELSCLLDSMWDAEPSNRPSASRVVEVLSGMKEELLLRPNWRNDCVIDHSINQ
eukprot:TRINITY_DN4455_c0_g2_i2.p1 TRINITY_DN4455_c0_g2~~TRINITY_DN4455_c0_g2_i2.p1  ORF type:complete len:325 (+),score=72.28 TRINITY_DN4455_c0_g2_i2:799-1773(+)